MLQAVTQMNQSHSGLNVMPPHPSSLDFESQQPEHLQALQHPESDHLPRRRSRKREEIDANKQVQQQKAMIALTNVL